MARTTLSIMIAGLVLAAPLLTGCGESSSSTKAGGAGAPVTLRIGTDDFAGEPAARQVAEFARRVERLSDGKLRIEPVWHAAGSGSDWDQRNARLVTDGKLELGWIPARAWDVAGVTSMRALNAPFLITSEPLTADIVSGDLSDELMSGLEKVGVVGLALVPEGLRHPFGYRRPLLGPEDYTGTSINMPTSKTGAAVFAELGATTTDAWSSDDDRRRAEEIAYDRAQTGTATGNVTFYPKVNTLVANTEALDRLRSAQRKILEQAGAQTRDWAIATRIPDAQLAQRYCAKGRRVVLASPEQLAALESSTRSVTASLERDPQTRRLIAAIRRRKLGVAAPAPPAPCGAAAPAANPAAAASPAPSADAARLNGVYRFALSDDLLRRSGVTDDRAINENHGVYTWTLEDGKYCWTQKAPNPLDNPDDCATYEVDGDRLVLDYPDIPSESYRFARKAGGDLDLSVVKADAEGLPYARAFSAVVWKRIGDAK